MDGEQVDAAGARADEGDGGYSAVGELAGHGDMGPGLFDFTKNIGNIPSRTPDATSNKDIRSILMRIVVECSSFGGQVE
jgi:hypothetical protein